MRAAGLGAWPRCGLRSADLSLLSECDWLPASSVLSVTHCPLSGSLSRPGTPGLSGLFRPLDADGLKEQGHSGVTRILVEEGHFREVSKVNRFIKRHSRERIRGVDIFLVIFCLCGSRCLFSMRTIELIFLSSTNFTILIICLPFDF